MSTAAKQIQSVAEAYYSMQNPPALVRPTWVPASISEAQVPAFTKAIIEARLAKESKVVFEGKTYAIKEGAPDADVGKAAVIQKKDHEEGHRDAPLSSEKPVDTGAAPVETPAPAAITQATLAADPSPCEKLAPASPAQTPAEEKPVAEATEEDASGQSLPPPAADVPTTIPDASTEKAPLNTPDACPPEALPVGAPAETPAEEKPVAESNIGEEGESDCDDDEDGEEGESDCDDGDDDGKDPDDDDGEADNKELGEAMELIGQSLNEEAIHKYITRAHTRTLRSMMRDYGHHAGKNTLWGRHMTHVGRELNRRGKMVKPAYTQTEALDGEAIMKSLSDAYTAMNEAPVDEKKKLLLGGDKDVVKEDNTVVDQKGGPEVMDPATKKMIDDAAAAIKISDQLPKAAPEVKNGKAPENAVKESMSDAEFREDHHKTHVAALSKAAHSASKLANVKHGSHEHAAAMHGHAYNLHNMAHEYTAASSTDHENKLSHEHNKLAQHHLYMSAGHQTAPLHHSHRPEFDLKK